MSHQHYKDLNALAYVRSFLEADTDNGIVRWEDGHSKYFCFWDVLERAIVQAGSPVGDPEEAWETIYEHLRWNKVFISNLKQNDLVELENSLSGIRTGILLSYKASRFKHELWSALNQCSVETYLAAKNLEAKK